MSSIRFASASMILEPLLAALLLPPVVAATTLLLDRSIGADQGAVVSFVGDSVSGIRISLLYVRTSECPSSYKK